MSKCALSNKTFLGDHLLPDGLLLLFVVFGFFELTILSSILASQKQQSILQDCVVCLILSLDPLDFGRVEHVNFWQLQVVFFS